MFRSSMSVPTVLVLLTYGSSSAYGLTSFGNSSQVSTSSSSTIPPSSHPDFSRTTITSSPNPIGTSLGSNGSIPAQSNSSHTLNESISGLQNIYSAANACQKSWLAYWSAHDYALTKEGIVAKYKDAIFDEYSTSVRFGNLSTAANGLVFSLDPTYGSFPLGVKTTSRFSTPYSLVYPTASIPAPSCCASTSMLAAQMTRSYSAALLSFEKEHNLSPGTVVTMTSITTITSLSTSYLKPGTQIYYLSDGLPRGRTTGISEVIQPVSSLGSSLTSSTQGGGVGAGFPLLTEWWSKSVSAIPNAALKPDQMNGMCNITYPVNCTQCVLYADKVELLYWPVSLTWKGNRSSTITPAVLPTTVYHGSTLSYGTAYLSYSNLADIACNMGSRYTEKIIAVPTDAISVVQGWNQRVNLNLEMTTVSLNIASLPPNPAASYLFDIGNDPKRPNTMWDDKFDYRLLFPSQIRGVDPAWSDCGYSWEATDDPPIALQSALSLTESPISTSTVQQKSSSAKPGESVIPATASKSTAASPSTSKETTVSTPDQTKVSGSSAPLIDVSPSVGSTPTTADIADAIASALGLEKPTTTKSIHNDQTVISSQQETATRQSGSKSVASVLIVSNGQVLSASTATNIQVSSNPTAITKTGLDSATPVLILSAGQALSIPTAVSKQTTPNPLAETQSGSEAVASVLTISNGQALAISTAAGRQISPNPVVESSKGDDQVLATIQLLGSSAASAQAASTSTLQTVIEGHTVQLVGTDSGIIVDSTLLQPGETTMIGSVPISVGTGFFQANSQTVSLPGSTEVVNAELTNSVISGNLVVGSTTLTAGGAAITAGGHTYSVVTDGLVQDGSMKPPTIPTVATALANGEVVLGSTTLTAGGAAVTTFGHTYSVGNAGLLQDGHAMAASTPTAKDSDVVTVLANGGVIVGSSTLSAGGAAIIILGHTYSVATGGLVRDDTTISMNTASTATKDSDFLTVLANGAVVAGATTLTAGGAAITTLGHTISVGSKGVVRDGTTIPVSMWSSRSGIGQTASSAVQTSTRVSEGPTSSSARRETLSSKPEIASSSPSATLESSDSTVANASSTSTSKKSSGQRLFPTLFTGANLLLFLTWFLW